MDPLADSHEVFAGRFTLWAEVGRGTQGTVHRAFDRKTQDPVALKIYRGGTPTGEVDDFLARARTIATLADPCQVAYVSAGEHGGHRFLAMEWVAEGRGAHRGKRLTDWLSGGALCLADGLEVCKRVARALARLHRAGLVHGNVKPDNVLVPPEGLTRARLSDGLVNLWAPVRVRYGDRWFRSTAGFASPRMIRTGAPGPQDDVHSLGALLFRCIAGCMPFPEHDRPDPANIEPASKTPRRVSDYVPSLWPEVQELVDRLLAHDPARRPADAVEPCLTLYRLAHRLRSRETIQASELDTRGPLPRFFELEPPPAPPVPPGFDPRLRLDPSVFERPPVGAERPSERMPSPPPTPEIRLQEGDLFLDRFRVEEIAGAGSTGVVYKVKDVETKDEIALRIHDGRATSEEQSAFFADIKKVSAYYQPRLLRVVRSGTHEGRLFLAMDWVSGETLQARLDRQPLTMREAFTVIGAIGEGLRSLHGVVQGNLRPRNVLLRNRNVEWVKLSDVAVRRERAPAEPSLEDAAFVAPELVRTGGSSTAGDLYAWGVIAFRILTGCLPFEADSLSGLENARKQLTPRLVEMRPDAPPALCSLVDALVHRDPGERPASAIEALRIIASLEDLGWGADNPPMRMGRDASGQRRPLLPSRAPLDPLGDALFQDFLGRELQARCPDPKAHPRLFRIAHAMLGPGTGEPSCALCAHPGEANRGLVEIREGGFFPVEPFAVREARQPALCVPCIQEPFMVADAAVKRMLADHQGDSGRPLGLVGATRGEVCAGLKALLEASFPRVERGACAVCRASGDVVRGARLEVCPGCLSAAARAHAAWLAEAPVRKIARDRARFNEMYRLGEERAGRKKGALGAPKEGVDDLPTSRRMWANGSSCKFELDRLKASPNPTQAAIDALADQFADALLHGVFTGIEGDPDVGEVFAIAETGYLPRFVSEYRDAFRPRPEKDERLRVAIAVMAEACRRGLRVYQKDDDNHYTHNVSDYFSDFETMPVR